MIDQTEQQTRISPEASTVTPNPAAFLPGALSFVVSAVTAAVVAGIVLGWGVAAAVAVVSAIALVAGSRGHVRPGIAMLGPYVLVIVSKLVADSVRFGLTISGTSWSSLTGSTDQVWYLGMVVAPVTLMLLGGYLIGRRQPVGSILAWWTPLLAAADGLWTMATAARLDRPGVALAIATAALVEALTATWAVQRLLRPAVTESRVPPVPLTTRQRNLWTVMLATGTIVYGVMAWLQAGPLLVGVIGGSMMGGLIGWRKTTSRSPADPAFHAPLFLLMLALFYFHVGEEGLTGFNQAIAGITGHPWTDNSNILFIGLAGPAVWVFGVWSLWKRQPFGNFIHWFLIVGMILGEPAHLLVFPVVKMIQSGGGYGYFSGAYTALFAMVPAIIMLGQIIRTHRNRVAPLTSISQDQP